MSLTMGISRRFLNLVVNDFSPGVRSLRCIDLTRQQFFDPTISPPANGDGSQPAVVQDSTFQTPAVVAGDHKDKLGAAGHLMMERIRLPDPTFSFQAAAAPLNVPWKIDCFPLADRKVVCADQLGRTFFFDAVTRLMGTMPDLHKPKRAPFTVFVPDADADNDLEHDGGSRLYVMERAPKLELGTGALESEQFEAFVYRRPSLSTFTKSWDCQLLPPPPFVREARDSGHRCPEITSYAVISGGSKVCISADGAGTYCLDTAKHTWRQVGRWTLPFHGKVEYVPELKLWFGLSGAEGAQLVAAADLSDIDSEPQLVGAWRELNPPE